MLPLLIGFVAFVAVFTLLAYLASRWMSSYVQRNIEGRLRALDRIVNEEQVPEEWLSSFRKRVSRLKQAGATPRQLAVLSGLARKRCLANIAELIRYVESTGLADTPETKQLMLSSLREQEERWRDDRAWTKLVDLTQPPPDSTSAAGA